MLTHDEIGALWKRWFKPIRQWLNSTSGDERLRASGGTIDDMAQEVFVRLLKYRTSTELPPVENIQGYLFRIAANVRNEFLERSVVKRMHSPHLLDGLIEEERPDDIQEAADMDGAVARCLNQLPPRTQRFVVLHVHEGLTYKQIAAREGCTYRTTLRVLTQAYAELRARAADDCRAAPRSERVKTVMRLEEKRAAEEQQREHERQRKLFKERAPKAEHEARRAELLAAIEAHSWCVSAMARALDMPKMTAHYRLKKYLPDYAQRRAHWANKRRGELAKALEEHRFSYAATAKALGIDDDALKRQLRTAFPDIEARKAAWKEQRREEVKRVKLERYNAKRRDQTRAGRAALAAARAAEAAIHTCGLVCSGVAQHAAIRALESTHYVLKDAAKLLGITVSKARHVMPRLVFDYNERRERAQQAHASQRRAQLLALLDEHKWSPGPVAAKLDIADSTFQAHCKALIPDYAERRARYLAEHSLGRCGGRLETEAEHAERLRRAKENRSKGTREFNTRKWAEGAAERQAARIKLLEELEQRRAEMHETHKREKAAMRAKQATLHRQYLSMRERQVKDLQALNTKLTQTRIAAGRRDSAKLAEERKQREAAKRAHKLRVLDQCGGDVHRAAVILGLHHTHVCKFKRLNWKPRGKRNERQSIANTG